MIAKAWFPVTIVHVEMIFSFISPLITSQTAFLDFTPIKSCCSCARDMKHNVSGVTLAVVLF